MDKVSHKIYLFIYKIKKAYFKNDLSVFLYSICVFFIGVIVYHISPYVGLLLPNFIYLPPQWAFKEFISFWVSSVGLIITALVSLKLSLRKTEDAEDFIEILTGELNRTPGNQEFGIILPNLNLAQYYFPEEFQKYRELINTVTAKGVKIKFIVPSLNNDYINTYDYSTDHHSKLGFFKYGESNGSLSLKYIYERYGKDLTARQCDDTIRFFREILSNSNVSLKELTKKDFIETNIVGFYSSHVAFIGQYSDLQSKNKRVTVNGEMIDVKESITLIEKYIVSGIVAAYN